MFLHAQGVASALAEVTAEGKGGTGQERGGAGRGKAESTTAPRGTGEPPNAAGFSAQEPSCDCPHYKKTESK